MSETLTYAVDADISKIQRKIQSLEKDVINLGKKGSKVNLGSSKAVESAGQMKETASKVQGAVNMCKTGMKSLGGGIASLGLAASRAHPIVAVLVAVIAGISAAAKKAIDGIESAQIGETLKKKLNLYTFNRNDVAGLAKYGERMDVDEEFLMQQVLPIARLDTKHVINPAELARNMFEAAGLDEGTMQSLAGEITKIASGKKITSSIKAFQSQGIDLIKGMATYLNMTVEEVEQAIKDGKLDGDRALSIINGALAEVAKDRSSENQIEMDQLKHQWGKLSKVWSNGWDEIWLNFWDGFQTCSFVDSIGTFEDVVRDFTSAFKRLFSVIGGVCGVLVSIVSGIIKAIRTALWFCGVVLLDMLRALLEAIPEKFRPDAINGAIITLKEWKNELNRVDDIPDQPESIASDRKLDRQAARSTKPLTEEEKQKQTLADEEAKYARRIEYIEQKRADLRKQYSGEELKFMEKQLDLEKTYTDNWWRFYKDSFKQLTESGVGVEEASKKAEDYAQRRARTLYEPELADLEAEREAYRKKQAEAQKIRDTEQEIMNLRARGEKVLADRLQMELDKQKEIAALVKDGRTQQEAETYYETKKQAEDADFIQNYNLEIAVAELRQKSLEREATLLEASKKVQEDMNDLIAHGMTEEQARAVAIKKNITLNDIVNKSVSSFQSKWGEFLKTISGWQKDEIYRAGGGYNNSKITMSDMTKSYQNGMTSLATQQKEITARIESYLAPNGWLSARLDNIKGGAVYA